MRRPIITLTTDFGLQDHFVGVMKGVILSIAPEAQLVDITHDISPQQIAEAAFTIAEAYRWFPKKTVHVVVVDPGVGTQRRPILVEGGGHRFVGPDNGVFSMVMERETCSVREITAQRFFLKPLSQTFHGRDVFSPVAAHLAKGVTPSQFGKKIADALRSEFAKLHRVGKRSWTANVLKVDRFGNLITGFAVQDFPQLGQCVFELQAGMERISLLVHSYAEAPPNEAVLIAGSAGYYEVVVNCGSAAKKLGLAAGSPLELTIW
ncbi:MAG: SAM-dependent chlorinase/fluorinase [Bryobacteraceae bacterium]|nr:SAM-dependent chlorinase/fluorinase [Bryobacteraceae bacterium]MDW8376524.1 SAM-dependent chlorinase/fluorinase [Bryobacterales bacterium]